MVVVAVAEKEKKVREKRDIKLIIRVSKTEHEEIKKRLGDHQFSALARTLLLGQELREKSENRRVLKVADPDLLRQLARIGNNINQIAKALNTTSSRVEHLAIIEQLSTISNELERIREHYVG